MEAHTQANPAGASETLVLTKEEKQTVQTLKANIDIGNKSNIIQYGAAAQTKMVAFSETVLTQIRNKDLGSVGDTLSNLVSDLKTFDKSLRKPGGIWGFMKSLKKKAGIHQIPLCED